MLLVFTMAVAWLTKYEFGYLLLGSWFVLTLISGILDFPRVIDHLRKAPAYYANLRKERKAELPWIVAIVVVNATYWVIGHLLNLHGTDKSFLVEMAEPMVLILICINLAMFGLMCWSLNIANRSSQSR